MNMNILIHYNHKCIPLSTVYVVLYISLLIINISVHLYQRLIYYICTCICIYLYFITKNI